MMLKSIVLTNSTKRRKRCTFKECRKLFYPVHDCHFFCSEKCAKAMGWNGITGWKNRDHYREEIAKYKKIEEEKQANAK